MDSLCDYQSGSVMMIGEFGEIVGVDFMELDLISCGNGDGGKMGFKRLGYGRVVLFL